MWWSHDAVSAVLMAAVAVTTLPLRQVLMLAINRATDAGQRRRFKRLYILSVLVTLCHIGATRLLLAGLG